MNDKHRHRCESCRAVNPKRHRKVDPQSRSWAYQYALLCPSCGNRNGFEAVPFERPAFNGASLR